MFCEQWDMDSHFIVCTYLSSFYGPEAIVGTRAQYWEINEYIIKIFY